MDGDSEASKPGQPNPLPSQPAGRTDSLVGGYKKEHGFVEEMPAMPKDQSRQDTQVIYPPGAGVTPVDQRDTKQK